MWAIRNVSSNADVVVLIFSKSPVAGTVKTRLGSILTETQALTLHLAFLQDTIEKVKIAQTEAWLYLTHASDLPFPHPLRTELQTGKDLGEKMQNAFTRALQSYSRVIMIGTDSPTFPPEQIHKAADALDLYDIVLGPCDDGGYYLIALKDSMPEAFTNIPWGSSVVLEQTLKALSNYRVHQLETCFDVDQPEDLTRLRGEVKNNNAPYLVHTRKWLESNPSAK